MQLYYSPLACSMASRIVAYEAGGALDFVRVDTRAGRLADGTDYRTINPLGQVPALKTDDGEIVTENAVVLQVLADAWPQADLAPPAGSPERYRLQQWLSFTGTELHKAVFNPLLSAKAPAEAKAYARGLLNERLDRLEAHLAGRDWLLERFSVADAYLAAVLNWTRFTAVDLTPWPSVAGYFARLNARPSVARAAQEELQLYQAA
ncbi:glutathione binding-like protein [Caulobacter sp. KR2-114]|uniref:glutathione binding-like protein n=1 Tax=Caulobacter sp. KR2-114 TaxID=3400912 RepID=UPI003C007235